MKVLLAKPTVPPLKYYGHSRSLIPVDNYVPSLGLGYLAAVLRSEGAEVRIHDPVVPEPPESIARLVAEWRPELLGLSLFTPHIRSLPDLFSLLTRVPQRPLVVAGGSHVSALPGEVLAKYPVDLCVLGEGERTLVEILRRLNAGASCRDVPGVASREGGEIAFGPTRPLLENLDALPFPARDLMPPLATHRPTPVALRQKPLAVVLTSRGCPYGCTFCDRAVFGRTYRARSAANVVDEIQELIAVHGAREIRFFDDDIAVRREHAVGLAEELLRRGVRLPWSCHVSARNADAELFRLFRRAGCWQVLMGIETLTDNALARLKKPTTVATSHKAIAMANAAGLRIRADFLLGTPGETLGDMERTIARARRLRVDFAQFSKFVPYPGTEIYRDLTAAGRRFDFETNWSDSDNAALPYVPEGVDPDAYRRLLDSAWKRFYLRPGYLLRRLARVRSWTEFKGHVQGLLAVFFL